MEGRLMMADALVYGQALYKPSLVIDVATFTRMSSELVIFKCHFPLGDKFSFY